MNHKFFISIAVPAFGLAACAGSTVAETVKPQAPTVSESVEALKAYPDAKAGQTKHIIHLPVQSDESTVKVELMVGKTMQVDCNQRIFSGKLETKTVQGWGYPYYEISDLGNAMSTLMGCPKNSGQKRFVTTSEHTMVRYNSRLPIVIYAPTNVEVRYRLWRAEADQAVQ